MEFTILWCIFCRQQPISSRAVVGSQKICRALLLLPLTLNLAPTMPLPLPLNSSPALPLLMFLYHAPTLLLHCPFTAHAPQP